MAQVTSGMVSVEDGKKAAEEYAPARKVRVDLSFTVEEGEDFQTVFDHVSNAASNRVASLLGTSAVRLVGSPVTGEEVAPPATRTRRTKAQIEADKAAQGNADPAAVAEDPTGGEESVIHLPDANDPAAISDGPSTTGNAGGAQTSADPAAIDGAEMVEDWEVQPAEAAKEITDADLNSSVQKRNGELGAPQLIRDLIGGYNPDKSKPFQLRQIPQAERQGFLDKLNALKKPAA